MPSLFDQQQRELAQHIRDLDMLKQSTPNLVAWCKTFAISPRGTREELLERVSIEVFRRRYD